MGDDCQIYVEHCGYTRNIADSPLGTIFKLPLLR